MDIERPDDLGTNLELVTIENPAEGILDLIERALKQMRELDPEGDWSIVPMAPDGQLETDRFCVMLSEPVGDQTYIVESYHGLGPFEALVDATYGFDDMSPVTEGMREAVNRMKEAEAEG